MQSNKNNQNNQQQTNKQQNMNNCSVRGKINVLIHTQKTHKNEKKRKYNASIVTNQNKNFYVLQINAIANKMCNAMR